MPITLLASQRFRCQPRWQIIKITIAGITFGNDLHFVFKLALCIPTLHSTKNPLASAILVALSPEFTFVTIMNSKGHSMMRWWLMWRINSTLARIKPIFWSLGLRRWLNWLLILAVIWSAMRHADIHQREGVTLRHSKLPSRNRDATSNWPFWPH